MNGKDWFERERIKGTDTIKLTAGVLSECTRFRCLHMREADICVAVGCVDADYDTVVQYPFNVECHLNVDNTINGHVITCEQLREEDGILAELEISTDKKYPKSTTDRYDPQPRRVKLCFYNRKSLDTLIDQLQTMRTYIEDNDLY